MVSAAAVLETAQQVFQPMFYIWSYEHQRWWRPQAEGYTSDITEAGLYTSQEAGEIFTDDVTMDDMPVLTQLAQRHGAPPRYHPYGGLVGEAETCDQCGARIIGDEEQ